MFCIWNESIFGISLSVENLLYICWVGERIDLLHLGNLFDTRGDLRWKIYLLGKDVLFRYLFLWFWKWNTSTFFFDFKVFLQNINLFELSTRLHLLPLANNPSNVFISKLTKCVIHSFKLTSQKQNPAAISSKEDFTIRISIRGAFNHTQTSN